MKQLSLAIGIATTWHDGQVDKVGQPYILHPLRVMLAMEDDNLRQVAMLHDVLEDCPVEATDLLDEGFSPMVVQAVEALTKRESEDYEAYIARLLPNDWARRVKWADLTDNLSRAKQNQAIDQAKIAQYEWAMAEIKRYENHSND